MKRIISIVLVGVLLIFETALASEFALRGGIQFGDTLEAVLEKETLPMNDFSANGSEEDEDYNPLNGQISSQRATITGIDDSYLTYFFNEDGKLSSMKYYYPSVSSKDTQDDRYQKIYEGLVRKYGAPLGNTNGTIYIFADRGAIYSSALFTALMQYINSDGYYDIRDYDEWVIDCDGYHVKIEICEYYAGAKYADIEYSLELSYVLFTDEDLLEKMQEKSDQQDAVDNDL